MADVEFYSYKVMNKKGGSESGYRGCEYNAKLALVIASTEVDRINEKCRSCSAKLRLRIT
jgi:hypothetical protein